MDGSARTRDWSSYLAVESATALSGTANGITTIALPWLVLERTGSATAAGVLAAITAFPTMLAALLSGTVVDRVGRRFVCVVSDLLSLVSVALIPLLDLTVGLSFGMLVGLAVLGAVFDPAGVGAKEAMLPEAAARADLALSKANGIHEAVWGASFVVGPALGGLCIAVIGPANTFWATAVVFALSALVIAVVPVAGGGRPAATEHEESFWRATGAGITFVWHERLLRMLCIIMMIVVGLWLPIEGVILPAYFEGRNQPGDLGLVLMALSLGGIVGALAYGWLAQRVGNRLLFTWSLATCGVTVVAASALPATGWLALWSVLAGLTSGPLYPIINVAMQTLTPSRLRGRVVGLLTAVQYAAGPFGFLLAGPLVDAIGVSEAFRVLAVLFAIVGASTFVIPALRLLDDLPAGIPDDLLLADEVPPRPMS